MHISDFNIAVASIAHIGYSKEIVDEMESSAKRRGTGIAKRTPTYISQKMLAGEAVIAINKDGEWAGFCYIQTWSDGQYVSNSGLIVSPKFRQLGLAKAIKEQAFDLSRRRYPQAKLFGLTTGLAVMRINSELGYIPVPFSELTEDESFWRSCESCVNYPILVSKQNKHCLCTAMLFDPRNQRNKEMVKVAETTTKGPAIRTFSSVLHSLKLLFRAAF